MGLGMWPLRLVDGTHSGHHHLSTAAAGEAPARLYVLLCFSIWGPLASPCSPAEEVLAAHPADETTEA